MESAPYRQCRMSRPAIAQGGLFYAVRAASKQLLPYLE
jgi:hypothetical protein